MEWVWSGHWPGILAAWAPEPAHVNVCPSCKDSRTRCKENCSHITQQVKYKTLMPLFSCPNTVPCKKLRGLGVIHTWPMGMTEDPLSLTDWCWSVEADRQSNADTQRHHKGGLMAACRAFRVLQTSQWLQRFRALRHINFTHLVNVFIPFFLERHSWHRHRIRKLSNRYKCLLSA